MCGVNAGSQMKFINTISTCPTMKIITVQKKSLPQSECCQCQMPDRMDMKSQYNVSLDSPSVLLLGWRMRWVGHVGEKCLQDIDWEV